ncbi:Holliday junction resolvase RuvX [bacterium]|nr:Holliday junction resolvase RuvX [bacterium]
MILAIDYGRKEIGTAIGNIKLKISHPYKILKNDKNLFLKLKKIIFEKSIEKIIVGWPVSFNSNQTKQTRETKEFVDKLKKEIKIPIEIYDERLTSKMADRLLKNTKNKKNHAVAAMIILQDYLTRRKK